MEMYNLEGSHKDFTSDRRTERFGTSSGEAEAKAFITIQLAQGGVFSLRAVGLFGVRVEKGV